jgi:hypothetical protein
MDLLSRQSWRFSVGARYPFRESYLTVVIKRIVLAIGGVALIVLLRTAYLVGVGLGFWQPLTRPVGIPSRARYVDTFKSAAWFDCSVEPTRSVDICRAWDTSGILIAFGSYRLDGENRAATSLELRPSRVLPYPGHPNLAWIYLFDGDRRIDGRTLVPVNEAGQPLERFDVRIGK